MSGRVRIRRQRPVLGGRRALSPLVLKETDERIRRIAAEHAVSKSFVVAVALADHFGIRKQERFRGS